MIPETHPLIESITEPFANDAERRMDARIFLGKTFDPTHGGVPNAISRLQLAGQRRFSVLRKVVPWTLAATLLAVAVCWNPSHVLYTLQVYNAPSFDFTGKLPLPSGLTEAGRLLLGDSNFMDALDQKQRLHLLAPENPAYFAEYAQEFVSEKELLPPDFAETAAQLAPTNSFFPYFAAGLIGKESISKNRGGTASPPRIVDGVRLSAPLREAEFTIKDQVAFDAAMDLIVKATELSDFETYTKSMIAARTRLLPVTDLAQLTHALTHAYGTSSGIIRLRNVLDLLCARAEQLSKSGRKDEFIALIKQREAFINHLGRNPDINVIGELVHLVIAAGTATNFRFAAERLGLMEIAENYRKQGDAIREHRDQRTIRNAKKGDFYPNQDQASFLSRQTLLLISRQVSFPPPISAADLEPMRRAEQEFASRLGVIVTAIIILFAGLVVFLFRFITPSMIRHLAKRMSGVLGMADWIWVIGLGVLLPLSVFLIATRLTPLGERQYGESALHFLFPGVQLVAFLLGLLIVPGIIVRWRVGKVLAPLGLADRFTIPLFGGALTLIFVWLFAALPLLARVGMGSYTVLGVIAAPPAFCLFLAFVNALRSVFGKPAARLLQCATAVAVLPAYPIAIIALCSLTPLYFAWEKHWIAKETLIRINPHALDLGAYEFKVAAQIRKEINTITGNE